MTEYFPQGTGGGPVDRATEAAKGAASGVAGAVKSAAASLTGAAERRRHKRNAAGEGGGGAGPFASARCMQAAGQPILLFCEPFADRLLPVLL